MILIDIDGVTADSHQVLIEELQSAGHDVSVDDITSWSFGQLREKTGLTTKQCIEELWRVWRECPQRIRPLDDGVVEVTNWILKTYESGIVTANPIPGVKDWLSSVGISTQRYLSNENKTELGYSVLIEDNPTIALNGHHLLLRDRPWNRELQEGTRFYHSSALPRVIEQLARQGVVAYR